MLNASDKPALTLEALIREAKAFCEAESTRPHASLYGVTDGKAVGTHVEHAFREHLLENYTFTVGSSAMGIDLPSEDILTDIKVTSIRQPQSSCPFRDAKQKIFGLGYNLLLFVYDKIDDPATHTATLQFTSCAFISKERTADYTTTYRLLEMLKDQANEEDIIAFLSDKNIPTDEIGLEQLAKQIVESPPLQGYLTISNALQWRLQYQRIVSLNQQVEGIVQIFHTPQK